MHVLVLLFLIFASTGSYGESSLEKANGLYTEGKYTQAVQMYKNAIQAGENPVLAHFNIANAYYQIDSVAKAIVYYQLVIRDAPLFFRAYLNLGILYYNFDALADAATVLEKAIALEPTNQQTMLILAATYTALEEYSLAVPLLEDIIEKDSTSCDDCFFLLYDINRKIGDKREAKKWIIRYPDNRNRVADKYQILADLSVESKNNSDAIYFYNRLINLVPSKKWPFYQLVKIYADEGTVLTALHIASEALQKHPQFAEIATLAASIAFEHGYYYKAEEFFTKAYNLKQSEGLVGLQNLLKVYEKDGNGDRIASLNNIIAQSNGTSKSATGKN